jgi:predicted nucleotidyltransferase
MDKIKALLKTDDYKFLYNDMLKDNICLLTLGGSHAYGTNIEGSDVDVRGIFVPSKNDIILGIHNKQYINTETDTVIYELDKIINYLSECNPNTIEMLGCKPEQYLYVNAYGKMILDNKEIFLSKKAIPRFTGYANQQLYRLKQKSLCALSNEEYNDHIAKVIIGMKEHLTRAFGFDVSNCINSYEKDGHLMFDLQFNEIEDEKLIGLVDEIKNTVNNYKKKSNRNNKAIKHEKLNKHAMHLIRLYMMGIDLLEKKEIITYRSGADHELLMDIRNKKYFNENDMPNDAFFDILNEYEKRFEYAKKNTELPDEPNYKEINELVYIIKSHILYGGI